MLLAAIALLSALHSPAARDSVTGTWQITGDVMGNPINELCTIQQSDSTLTGNCAVAGDRTWPISGEIGDTSIVFRHYGEYNGDKLTLTFTARRVSPTQLKGKLVVQPFGVEGDFTATPVPPAAPAAPVKP